MCGYFSKQVFYKSRLMNSKLFGSRTMKFELFFCKIIKKKTIFSHLLIKIANYCQEQISIYSTNILLYKPRPIRTMRLISRIYATTQTVYSSPIQIVQKSNVFKIRLYFLVSLTAAFSIQEFSPKYMQTSGPHWISS